VDRVRSSLPWIAAGLLIGIGAGALLYFGFGPGKVWFQSSSPEAILPAVPEINKSAPDFMLNTLDGRTIQLSKLRGSPVVLNFWATWCGPCRLEMPLLQEYADQLGADVVFLPINNDESPELVQKFVDELSLRLDFLLDPGAQVAQQYRVRGFPTTMFIDRDGTLRYQHIGVLNEELLIGYLQGIGAMQ
jgi:thiol-disulfide isomerase/thioredoxin